MWCRLRGAGQSVAEDFIAKLEQQKQVLTIEGKLDAAVKVKSDVERLRKQFLNDGRLPLSGLARGLVLCYSFDRDDGRVVSDKSGSKNDGRVHGATWTREGRVGGCMSFDGKDDYIDAGNRPSLTMPDGEISIAAWLKPDRMQGRIVCKRKTAYDYICELNPNGMGWAHCDPQNVSVYEGASAAAKFSGGWEHLAWVCSKQSVSFYHNGKLVSEKPIRLKLPANEAQPVWIGADTECGLNTQWVYGGLMDDLMIWRRCLTASDIAAIVNSK
jgi:hypothetical protein